MLPIESVWPDALDDLKYLVADVELVVELRMGTSALTFYVKFHEGV